MSIDLCAVHVEEDVVLEADVLCNLHGHVPPGLPGVVPTKGVGRDGAVLRADVRGQGDSAVVEDQPVMPGHFISRIASNSLQTPYILEDLPGLVGV